MQGVVAAVSTADADSLSPLPQHSDTGSMAAVSQDSVARREKGEVVFSDGPKNKLTDRRFQVRLWFAHGPG